MLLDLQFLLDNPLWSSEPYTHYPDTIAYRALPTADQQAFAFAPQPEQQIEISSVSFPDWLAQPPALRAYQQQAFAANVTPERTAPMFPVWMPDRVDRPYLAAANQLAVTNLSPFPEQQQNLDWAPSYPERALRTFEPASAQPFFALDPFPRPSLITFGFTNYPDLVRRPFFPTTEHQFFAASITPERTSPLAWTYNPDRIDRPYLTTANQPFVTSIFPKPEEARQLDWNPNYPDRALKPWLLTALQSTFAFAPFPEEKIDLDWQPNYPERARRAFLPTSDYPFVSAFAPFPERTAPMFPEIHPDFVLRPFYLVTNQLAVTELSPKPEEQKQLDWDPSYPERALRSWMSTAEQPFFSLDPAPRPGVTPIGLTYYPDRIIRTFLPTALMPAFVASQQPERTKQLADSIYPDRVLRPLYPAAEQPFVTGLSPKPEEKQDLDWSPNYPDRAIRATGLAASRQLFVTEVYPRPEEKIQLDWEPVYPDRAVKLWLKPSQQQAYTSVVTPPAPPTFIELVYPDQIARAFFSTALQLAVTEIELQQIAPVGGPPAFMSTSVGRANQLDVGVGKSVGLSIFVSRGNGLNASIGKFTSLTVRIGKA